MNDKCKTCPLMNADRACPGQRNTAVCKQSHRPGILRKILNFGQAVAQHVAAGMPMATEEQANARLAICRSCDHFDTERHGCRKCGCSMDIKAGWAGSACPLNPPKWLPIVPEAASEPAEPANA